MRLGLLPLVAWLLGGCGLVTSIVGGGGIGTIHATTVATRSATAQAQVVHAVNGRYSVQQAEQVFGSFGLSPAKVTTFAGGTVLSYRRPLVSVFVANKPKSATSTVFLGRRRLQLHRVRRLNLEIFFGPAARPVVEGAITALR